jgi:hypothetical protein
MLISAHRELRNIAEGMTNNVPDMVRRFLDIKAQVGNEEEDDGYGDEPPGELTLVFFMSAVNICSHFRRLY